MDPELALRLRVEALIAGFADLGIEEAMTALAEVEAVASALAATRVMDADDAFDLVADTVDALVVRGASWVEAAAVDLDVRRLYDLAAGAPRPRLRRVVAVATGALASVDLWDDRAEVRTAGGPSVHLDAVAPGDHRLDLRDEGGGVVSIDLSAGRVATEGGETGMVDAAEYVRRLEVHAASAARRDPSVEHLNSLRRRLGAVAATLGIEGAVERFDAAVVEVPDGPAPPALLDVVPVAVRIEGGWVLSVERWTDHWRAVTVTEAPGLWTAVDDRGGTYGGEPVGADVIRFDPPLDDRCRAVTVQRLGRDGTSIEVAVEVRP